MSIFNIDRSSLDEEWSGQSELFYGYAEKLAFARKDYDHRKSQVEVIKAKTAMDIRRNPKDYLVSGRLTDKIVADLVTTDKRVQRATHLMNEARHSMEILQAAVTALEHRKRALEGLVSLHGQSYFATPRVKGEASKEFIETAQKKAVRRKGIRKQT